MPLSTGGAFETSLPSIRTLPTVASSRPEIILSKVVFPQPDGPTKTTNSLSLISRLISNKTSVSPKLLLIFSSFTVAILLS